ncbi:Ribosomal_S18 domain-containing protein [Cephalotus follicularis]|uniref:Small ribosomal subunit protein bS18c n=1 Tax=Cephalotus follicularis TaxID=3775 RepID=A0A1Q3BF85_CEPFO|nr:Ribosomal_S18 domain-containing protein [Cephalotus follicularis]
MKIAHFALRTINDAVSRSIHRLPVARTLSTNAIPDNGRDEYQNSKPSESADEFERRIFGGISGNSSSTKTDAFFQKLDRLGKGQQDWTGFRMGGVNDSTFLDSLDESFSNLSDGMDGKLKKSAMDFEFDLQEVEKDEYMFRPDVQFRRGDTYTTKDLDLTKPGVRRPPKRFEFETTTAEVLKKADFRNVRLLANFLTDAGIIIKRSKTGISAKAQRKVAREIKTARAFGLMPFTTMGTKSFIFGKTMEDRDEDYEYEYFDNPIGVDDSGKDPLGP